MIWAKEVVRVKRYVPCGKPGVWSADIEHHLTALTITKI